MSVKVFAIIVAGGSGSRMNSEEPKQFISLMGKPIIIHTLDAFRKANPDIHLIVVLPDAHMNFGMNLLQLNGYATGVQFARGGDTRFHSVKNGLDLVTADSIVLVHDAVRCLLSHELISKCILKAEKEESAIPVIMSRDSIRQITNTGSRNLTRQEIRIVQTPQAFNSVLLKESFQQAYQDTFTDEASVVQYAGHSIQLIEGEEENIKITFPMDLIVAERLLSQREV
jgi:2-C-methyl-D-erythritol 4-phosphate cytidylyltransferase